MVPLIFYQATAGAESENQLGLRGDAKIDSGAFSQTISL